MSERGADEQGDERRGERRDGKREARAEAERAIRAAHDAGDFARATTIALEAYGREISSFIAARVRSVGDAGDVFGAFALDVWNGLPNFRFSSSFRTWAYTLARHAIARHRASPHERRKIEVSTFSPLAERLVHETRAHTDTWKKTHVKDTVRALRDRLDDEEQEILILRVDRAMPFDEIARVLTPDLDDADVKKRAAAIRKRFERAKERLRTWALEEGLLDPARGGRA